MLNKLFISTLFASSFAFTGCASTPNTSNTTDHLAALQNKNWVLTQIDQVNIKTAPNTTNLPALRFDASALSGTDGCNRISGGYTVQAKKIEFLQLAKTQMMCMDGVDLSNQFNQAIERVHGFKAYSDKLELLDKHENKYY